jgi:restriction modification system DNA specificity domain protein
MSEWPMVKLGEVCKINPRRDKSITSSTEISFIEMKSLLENGNVHPVTVPVGKYLKGYTPFQKHDILIAKITPCFQNGKIGLANIDTDFGFGTTEFHVVRSGETLSPEYLTFFLRQQWILDAGEKCMTGSGGQRRVPKAFLENLKLPLPPFGEQKRIAEILGGASKAINEIRTEIKRVELLCGAVVSLYAEDQSTKKLEDLATLSGGLSLGSHRKNKPHSVGYLRVANVFWGKILYDEIKELNCTDQEFERTLLQDGDVLITEAHANRFQVGRSAVFRGEEQALVFQNHLFRARPNKNIDSDVLAAMLSSVAVRRQLYQMTKTTSGLNTISISQVRSLRVPVLDTTKQAELLSFLQESNKLNYLLHRKLSLLQELQKSLSSRAFAGLL